MKGEEVVKLYVAKFGRKRGKDDAADDTETTTEQSPDLQSDSKKGWGSKLEEAPSQAVDEP